MRDFVITTDSTVDLPKEWLEEHRVPTLRLAYTIDGETYPDMEGLSKKDFSTGSETDLCRRLPRLLLDRQENYLNLLLKKGKTSSTSGFLLD